MAASWPNQTYAAQTPRLELGAFRALVSRRGEDLYRDLPWRRTYDPYAIWVSEVMLQQTQVQRVDGRWQRWLQRFPTVEALAAGEQAAVLAEWQGLGYNRRALALLHAARTIVEANAGFPQETHDLLALPGIGPATAAGIRAFAFNLPGVYLETNVRTVFLHELFPAEVGVPDKLLVPLVEAACPDEGARSWYYALLDYGAWLKRHVPNPSRRSRSHVKQSEFEGSHRQKRATVVRILLAAHEGGLPGLSTRAVAQELSRAEVAAGRERVCDHDAELLLGELAREGFCSFEHDVWHV